jgi:hypothetical protein
MSSSKVVLLFDFLLEMFWFLSASHMINRRGFSPSLLVVQVYFLNLPLLSWELSFYSSSDCIVIV